MAAPVRAGRGMNLLFCSLDTLRADRLGCLGNGRGLTPNLDRIASEGALFAQAYASDIPTQPSHTAIFTGQFGMRTGIVSHFHPAAYLDEETLWMPSLLRRHGYVTGAVDHLFAMKDWFIRGYDDYMPPPGRSRSPGSVINEIGFPWLERPRVRGVLPLSALLGRPHPLRAALSLQGALLARHGRPDRSRTSTTSSRGGPATRCSSRTCTTSSRRCPTSTSSPTSTTPKSPTSTSRSAACSTIWASSDCSMTPWWCCSATTART